MDLYEVLGVDPEASSSALRIAYCRRVRQYHPDVQGHERVEQAGQDTAAAERLREIIEAYQVLRDPDRRSAYDRGRSGRPAGRSAQPGTRASGNGAAGNWPDAGWRSEPVTLDLLRAVGPVRRHDNASTSPDPVGSGVLAFATEGQAVVLIVQLFELMGRRNPRPIIEFGAPDAPVIRLG